MYANNTSSCPVKLVKLFLEKTPENATSLFNRCVTDAIMSLFNRCLTDAIISPSLNKIWYDSTPLTPYAFKAFMLDLSNYAKLSQIYTALSIRATCIQAKTDANIQKGMMFDKS